MDLRHLRHFIAVAETLNFARAAQRLGMEQSPLSHSIRNFESELGTALFHRTTRKTWLTRAGVRLLADAQRILADVEAATAAVRDRATDSPCGIHLGLSEHAAGEPFTRLLFEMEHRLPPIAVDLREVSAIEGNRLVLDRVLDAAIVLENIDVAGLRRVRAWGEPLAIITAIGSALADRERLSFKDLETQRFVLPQSSTSPGYAGQIEALLRRYDVRPSKRIAVQHQNTMISFVSIGRGVALLPESIAYGLTIVAVVPLLEDDAELVSWLLYPDEDPSEAVSFVLEVAAVIDERGALLSDEKDGA